MILLHERSRCVGRPLGRRRGSRLRARVGASAGPLAAADLLHHGINAVCAHKRQQRDVSTAESRRRRGKKAAANSRGAAHRHPPSPAAFARRARGEARQLRRCRRCSHARSQRCSAAVVAGKCSAAARGRASRRGGCVRRGPLSTTRAHLRRRLRAVDAVAVEQEAHVVARQALLGAVGVEDLRRARAQRARQESRAQSRRVLRRCGAAGRAPSRTWCLGGP